MGNFNLSAVAFLFTATILSGCTNISPSPTTNKVESNSLLARHASCEEFYRTHDLLAEKEKVTDTQSTQIKEYPFLSVNRFLVSFRNELPKLEQQNFWLSEAAKLNRQKRAVEWGNLSLTSKESIKQKHLRSLTFDQRLLSCSHELLLRLEDQIKPTLITNAEVLDDYSSSLRTIGLYPLTSKIVTRQINKHQKSTRDIFNKKLKQLPIKGKLQRYVAGTHQTTYDDVVNRENALNIPFISSTRLNELFNQHSPTLEVDETGDYDKIGEVKLDNKNNAYVTQTNPIIYTMPSYTKFEGRILIQLNYVFWFPERPSQTSFDIYSGKFDGIIWRVTLNEDLKPLIYDSVHNCGCYHKFYSTKGVKFNLQTALKENEPPFLAQNNLKPLTNEETNNPWILRINSGSHFIERVYRDGQFDKNAITYTMRSYHQLRNLNHDKSFSASSVSKSLYADDGIVKSSKRMERFVLWPMGVPSAGAMRQWGHHAIAFVGKRYFDDVDLLDKYFTSSINSE